MEWDPGPPSATLAILELAPLTEYKGFPKRFRLEWGPIYYRGRLDGTARVLVIGQDPSADENVARRVLVGTAGQRVQGFLRKVGITRSYAIVNASLYSIYGQFDAEMKSMLNRPAIKAWRNSLLDHLATPNIQAIVAFGKAAQFVIDSWPGADAFKSNGRIFLLQHPTARVPAQLSKSWNKALPAILSVLPPDPDGVVDLTPYSLDGFSETDLARIPLRDFGFGAQEWMGTGDMATRIKPKQKKLATPPSRSAILWEAQGDLG